MYIPTPSEPHDAASLSILAIIVIYKKTPSESSSVQTLLKAVEMAASPSFRVGILVFDNTPDGQDPGKLPGRIVYRPAPCNPGLAVPYNEALVFAEQNGFSWLLTLDQDTCLPTDFLRRLEPHARRYEHADQIAAVVPQIVDHGRVISPFRFVGGFLPRVLPPGTVGIGKRFTSALNSGSLLRIHALRELGGYDLRFPLHNSDTRLYQRLDEAGKQVFIAGDIRVDHELAILQRESRMTHDRYRKLLLDECDFWDLHMGVLGRTERLLRLAGRLCKSYLKHEDPAFRIITRQEIVRRLCVRKRDRMRANP
jgi:GT2 family glycosyltransferase